MRPKKQILLVDADEVKLSLERFRFAVHGFRVHSASNGQEALQVLAINPDILVAVIALNGIRLGDLIQAMRGINEELKTILTSEVVDTGRMTHQADCFLGKGFCSPTEVLERVRVMSSRKRGPKKLAVIDGLASKRKWA